MTEPDAWEPTELEQKLLEAARGDRIPAELGLRMANALSISSVAPTASAVAHGGLLFSSKAGLWGFLSIALLAGAGALYTAGAVPRTAPRAAPAASAPASPVIPIDEPKPFEESSLELAPPRTAAAAPVTASNAKRDTSGALRAEVSVLDGAREALERGAPQRAWSLLDHHRQRFARGSLLPEAEAMRIETLVRLGDGARARRMSQRFLSAYPAHPLCERVSAVVATAP